jgi:hypothetical protein
MLTPRPLNYAERETGAAAASNASDNSWLGLGKTLIKAATGTGVATIGFGLMGEVLGHIPNNDAYRGAAASFVLTGVAAASTLMLAAGSFACTYYGKNSFWEQNRRLLNKQQPINYTTNDVSAEAQTAPTPSVSPKLSLTL